MKLETNDEFLNDDSRGVADRSKRERNTGHQRFLDQPVHAESRSGPGKGTAIHAVWTGAMEERGHERRPDRRLPSRRSIESVHCSVSVPAGAESEDDCVALRVSNDLPHDLHGRTAAP